MQDSQPVHERENARISFKVHTRLMLRQSLK